MRDHYSPLRRFPFDHPISYLQPPVPPTHVRMDSPAVDVMTDFTRVQPRTIGPGVPIDAALERMKSEGVRSLLVTDDSGNVIGLVSSYDIEGEKPIKLVEQSRAPRGSIRVDQVMTPLTGLELVDMLSVRGARVGHVVATLRSAERRYLLVSQLGEQEETPMEGAPDTYMRGTEWEPLRIPTRGPGRRWIRGMFSAAQVGRQLDVDLMTDVAPAHSLSELEFRNQSA